MTSGRGRAAVLGRYAREHPEDFALALGHGSVEAALEVLDGLEQDLQLRIVNRAPQRLAEKALRRYEDAVIAGWLASAPTGEARRLFLRLEIGRRLTILAGLTDRTRKRALSGLVELAPDRLGALADPEFHWVRGSWTVFDLSASLLASARRLHGAPILVLDEEDHLFGVLDTVECLQSHPDTELRDCTIPVRELGASATAREAYSAPGWKDSLWLPVVDRRKRPVGMLSRERLLTHTQDAPHAGVRLDDPMVALATDMFRVFSALAKSLLSMRAR
ncbi:MAG: hypothetical protein J4F97_03885 [Pseudomonadales bacterium]|nr:hypothetical protein [Pseudomonadales bacterium]